MPTPSLESRYLGCLLGLAAGDAVGTTVEFKRAGTFEPVTDMVGGGTFRLAPGQWTDDTSMALCLAASLVEQSGFDPRDQMERYLRWRNEGYMSSNGEAFDIGNTVREAFRRYRASGDPLCGPSHERSAGNGSLMRLAPIPMAYAHDPEKAMHLAAESSRVTHQHPAAIDGCRYYAGLIIGALQGASKEELLSPRYAPVPGYWSREAMDPTVAAVAGGSWRGKETAQLPNSGYVIHTLETALWAFDRTTGFREGVLQCANLGEDADTVAAVHGQLAGAYLGTEGIPQDWRAKLAMRDTLEQYAKELLTMSQRGV